MISRETVVNEFALNSFNIRGEIWKQSLRYFKRTYMYLLILKSLLLHFPAYLNLTHHAKLKKIFQLHAFSNVSQKCQNQKYPSPPPCGIADLKILQYDCTAAFWALT